MTEATITKTVFFSASRETVWEFLTRKDKLALWFHPAEADLAEGEPYRLIGMSGNGQAEPQCWGTVTRMEPPDLLEYTFTVKPLNGAMTTVRWTLEEALGGTRLTLVHEGIGEAAGAAALGLVKALDTGWDAHFADLRTAVAQ